MLLLKKVSNKLSLKNSICYETARNMIENTINKLEDENDTSNNIAKRAYKINKQSLRGGDPYYLKYLKYKEKYLKLKNEL